MTSAGHAGCLCHGPAIQALTHRISTGLSRRGFVGALTASVASLGFRRLADAQSPATPAHPARPIFFTNFRLFDGKSGSLAQGLSLLVDGNQVKSVARGNPAAPEGARTIDCGGRVLMPGLIDAHWHSIFAALSIATLMFADVG
jgi:hypothetical protein